MARRGDARARPPRAPVDGTWARANTARARGYAPRGERPAAAAPRGRGHATTLAGALAARGFIAPMALGGAANGAWFRAYVERVLVPELRRGGVVAADNLGSHAVAGARAAIAAAGREPRLLPPGRPDLNPIEGALSRPRRRRRSAAERAVGGAWSAVGRLLDRFHPAECRNYFRHCGYRKAATPS